MWCLLVGEGITVQLSACLKALVTYEEIEGERISLLDHNPYGIYWRAVWIAYSMFRFRACCFIL